MKRLLLLLTCCGALTLSAQDGDKAAINATLDLWHKAAAQAKFDPYFALMSDDAVFIGTDPTENWNKDAFKAFAKPYFDKGKAWNFTPIERHVFVGGEGNVAWFDELLDTQMKICRGSGVMKKIGGQWRIAHYVLSIAIPNDKVDDVVRLKTPFDDALTAKLKGKP